MILGFDEFKIAVNPTLLSFFSNVHCWQNSPTGENKESPQMLSSYRSSVSVNVDSQQPRLQVNELKILARQKFKLNRNFKKEF